jgi:hypothetical protein
MSTQSSVGAEAAFKECLEAIKSFYNVFCPGLTHDMRFAIEAIIHKIEGNIKTCQDGWY